MPHKKMTKEVIILLAIIAASVLFLLFQNSDNTHYTLPKLEKLDQKELSKLVIEKSEERIELDKRDGNWVVGPKAFPSDMEKVQKAIDAIASLQLTELISRSGNDALYDLTVDKKIRVSLYKGETLLRTIEMGKVGGTFRHTFIRLQGDESVYQASGALRNDLEHKMDDWRDKVIAKIDPNEVSGIILGTPEKSFEFSKEVTMTEAAEKAKEATPAMPPPAEAVTWKYLGEGKDPVKKETLDSLFSRLQELRCDRFAPEETPTGAVDYELTLKAAKPLTLTLFKADKEDATEILARSSSSPYLFYLSKWAVDGLKKGESDLFEVPQTNEKK